MSSHSRAERHTQPNRGTKRIQFTLGWGDYLAIIPIGLTIVGLMITMVSQLTSWIQSIDDRVSLLQEKVQDIDKGVVALNDKADQVAIEIREIKEFGVPSYLPAPNVSTIWFALRAGDKPFSEYTTSNGGWAGVWVNFSKTLGEYMNFSSIEYTLVSDGTLPASLTELNYVVMITKNNDPLVEHLVSEGWSQKPFDPYFQSAGFGPYDYSLFLSPKLVDSGFEIEFLTALSNVPTDSWVTWGEDVEKAQP